MVDVYVCIPDATDPDGWVYLWVALVDNKTDFGEIVAACQVLHPIMIGISIEPAKENDDATD